MITLMPTTARPQQRYDHRLRHLVHRTGDVTVATDLGVPRATARGWLGAAPRAMVCLDGADLTEPELRQEVLNLKTCVTHDEGASSANRVYAGFEAQLGGTPSLVW